MAVSVITNNEAKLCTVHTEWTSQFP